jgi:hypothetical protein
MLIQNTEPVVIPQAEAKTYPHLWISRVLIDAPSVDNARAYIELHPYNSTTKEILNSSSERIHIDNIWSSAQENPAIQDAINALLEAVNAIKNPVVVEENIVPTEEQ